MARDEEKMSGRGEFANMPRDVKFKPYPKVKGSYYGDLDDTITGIDSALRRAESKSKKYVSDQK